MRFRLRVGLGTVAALAALCGCGDGGSGSSGSTGTNPPQSVVVKAVVQRVSLMVFGDPAELAAYQELVHSFEAKRAEVKIELIHIPSQREYRRRLAADFAGGSPADIVVLNYRRFADLAARGAVEVLTPYFLHSSVLHEDKFYPQVLDAFTWKGRLYGVPQNVSSLVVYYNKALFDQAKLSYPKPGWTWDDFLRTAKALTRDTDGDGTTDQYGLGTEVSLARLAPFVWQNEGRLVDNNSEPTRLMLLEPEAISAIQWFVDLQVKHRVVPGRVAEKAEDSESRFQNGRTAMLLNSRRGVPTYREIRGFDWDVAPLPRHKAAASILHSDAYFIARESKVKEAAWRFIEFAGSEEGQTKLAATGRTVPSLRSVAESAAFLDPTHKPKNSRVFLDTLPSLQAAPQHPAWFDVEEIAGDELERAFYGEADVTDALAHTVERTTKVFRERDKR